jgi:hypothetical protein
MTTNPAAKAARFFDFLGLIAWLFAVPTIESPSVNTYSKDK